MQKTLSDRIGKNHGSTEKLYSSFMKDLVQLQEEFII